MTEPRSGLRPSNSVPSLPFCFADAPPGWPIPNTRGHQILAPLYQPPEQINVALHRNAKGVFRLLAEGEEAQEALWLTVPYELTARYHSGRVVYESAPSHRARSERARIACPSCGTRDLKCPNPPQGGCPFSIDKFELVTCPTCQGVGDRREDRGRDVIVAVCRACSGLGRVVAN